MRLLHWNIHMWRDVEGGDNKQAVADLIDRVAPDVVSLVEVDEPWGRPEGLRWLASELGYRSVFVPAFEYRGEGGFGNALLARPPIRSAQQWQLLSPRLYAGDEPSEPRAVVLAEVSEGPGWWVGSTHLPRNDPAMRDAASARLLQLVEQLGTPWVLCGDFNQPPTRWLPPPTHVAPNPAVATYPGLAPTEAIDYFVVGGCDREGRGARLGRVGPPTTRRRGRAAERGVDGLGHSQGQALPRQPRHARRSPGDTGMHG